MNVEPGTPPMDIAVGVNFDRSKVAVFIEVGQKHVIKFTLKDARRFVEMISAAVKDLESAGMTPDENYTNQLMAKTATLETELHAAREQISKLTCSSGD